MQQQVRICDRPDEGALLPRAVHILEHDFRHHRLTVDTLCRVHSVVANVPKGVGGKLRHGPAVIQLDGRPVLLPPPAGIARSKVEILMASIASDLDQGNIKVPAHVFAANVLVQFTELHPFPDGNGRVARVIATWLLVRAGYRPKPNLHLGAIFRVYRRDCYLALRHHVDNPWMWDKFFFNAVLTCFYLPKS